MGKLTTNELLDQFFASPSGEKYANHRKIIREEQLYAYELKIGKELVGMDVDELIEFFSNMKLRKNNVSSNMIPSNNSIDQILVIYRQIFDYYIEEIEVIKNPFRNPKMRGQELYKNMYKYKERLTWDMVEDIIRKLHKDFPQERADYVELIMLLYYNGFETAQEIVEMQENDINHKSQTVFLQGKTVHLSDRCYTLLTKFNSMNELEGWRNYVMASWHGSYFKFIVRENKAIDIDDRPLSSMRQNINVYLCKYVNNQYNTHINYSNLYLLGFYDYMVKRFGLEELDAMLLSNYDSENIKQLQQAAREYGFRFDNISHLKRRLRMFIKTNEE